MRLTPDQVNIIRTAVAQVAGADAQVWLFGSPVHDECKCPSTPSPWQKV